MTLPKDGGLYIFDIAAYAVLAPLVLYVTFKHGSRGLMGNIFLNIACAIRIVADILTLTSSTKNGDQPSMATAIVSSVGLSPLLFALAGLLDEVHRYLLQVSPGTTQSKKRTEKWLWFAQLQIHGAVVLGLVLVIVGTVKLESANSLTTSEYNTDNHLRAAGAVIVLIVWIVLLQYALFLNFWGRKKTTDSNILSLALWLLPAVAFIGIRCAYTVAYTFDHKDSDLSPSTGATWVKVIFVVLCPLFAVASMTLGGLISKDIKRVAFRSSEEDLIYEQVRPKGSINS